ncbi:MAG: hypothetical protein ACRCTA_05850 [Bacilli bacterium]
MNNLNISQIEATNQYYSALQSGQYTRAEKFKENVDINYVINTIFSSLLPQYNSRPSFFSNDQELALTLQQLEELRQKNLKSYNFIQSLINNSNDLMSGE